MATKSFDTTVNGPFFRKGVASTVAVHTTQGSCDILDFRGFRHLSVKPPTGVTSLTFYGSQTEAGTYVLLNDLGTAGVVTLTADVWTSIDWTKVASHSFLQMKSAGNTGNMVCLACT
jgi:hypothetical protein